MFWNPNINQGPIVEGTLKNNYISLVFIELGWQHYPVGDFISHAVPFWYSESWKFFRFDELF